MQLVRVCAELAQMRTDIKRMPMGHESLAGGTSHLDLPNERGVNAALLQLAITRLVVVTHRPSGRDSGSSPARAAWRGRRVVYYFDNRREVMRTSRTAAVDALSGAYE
jgi:hypothetical protein